MALWRYLKRETAGHPVLEETVLRIARGTGRRDPLPHTMVCLDVMCERGLITLEERGDKLRIAIIPTQGKVDLEESCITRRLRQMMEGI